MEIENNIQNTGIEGTTPNELETQQEMATESASDTVPQDPTATEDVTAQGESLGAESTAAESNAEIEPYLTVRFNHETRNLSLEEARMAAQKGIKYGEISEKLDRVAAIKGVSALELLDGMISAEREAYKNSLTDRLGDDSETVEMLMKLYDTEQAEKYNKAIADRDAETKRQEETLNSRLANEFTALKAEFPELKGYGDLPKEVRHSAEDGKDLMSAYLLHKYKEEKAAAAAKEAAEAAAKATAGSLSGEVDDTSSAEKDFLKGLWG